MRAFIVKRSAPVVGDRRARRRELAKPVVREHREVRLASSMIDDAEDARIRIDAA
jgi:hypothetical protein